MSASTALNIAALIAVLPATAASLRGLTAEPGRLFWLLLAVAVAGPVVWTVAATHGSWRTDLSFALWVSVSASLTVYAVSAVFSRAVARLAPVFLTLMTLLALLAAVSEGTGGARDAGAPMADGGWFWLHILVSVATYALLAVAAAASLAALIQERALKRKRPLTRLAGLHGHGMDELAELHLDHKTVFAIAAFMVIGALLIAHERSGARGRRVARLVLLAYLFVTLAYPGVKFVSGVLLG